MLTSISRRQLLGVLGATFTVAQRPALATLVLPPPLRGQAGDPVGTILWLENWLYRVITPNGGVACIPVRAVPTFVVDREMLVPTVTVIVRYDIRFRDQDGNVNQYGVDARPGFRTEAMHLLYRTLAERNVRYMERLDLELPPGAALMIR